jgi:hypothetical protein
MFSLANSSSVTFVPNSYLFLSSTQTIFSPFDVLVFAINSTTASTDISGLPPPVLAYEAKHSVFNLIPFRGAGGKMGDMYLQPRYIRKFPQLFLPELDP